METKRTNYTQLPAIHELKEIMKKEAWRDPPHKKKNVHYPKFKTFIAWLETLEIDPTVFFGDKPWEEILDKGIELEPKVVKKTLDLVEKNETKLEAMARRITEYLGENDVAKKSDLIFVFGSQSLSRIQTGIDLWRAKLAPKIFITGGSPHYKQGEKPEAILFKEYAIDHEVPEDAILIEPKAVTIADNVRRSINLFEEQGINYQKMILVTAWFAMRRSWVFMMKYIPESYQLFRVSSPVKSDGDFASDGWWKNPNGIKVVFNEFVKMRTGIALNTC